MRYGDLPMNLGTMEIEVKELMYYQYMLIKPKNGQVAMEPRLRPFYNLIWKIRMHFIKNFGAEEHKESNIYLTVKVMYVTPSNNINREGYHSDGFKTKDINYIWSDKNPTIFNTSEYNISQDELKSMQEMQEQSLIENEITYPANSILCLNQYNIHKCAPITEPMVRAFVKVSFTKDEYDLEYNTHNHLLDYEYGERKRGENRNVPQNIV